VTYFVDGDDEVPGLPDYLFCDGSLDDSLGRIHEFLQRWIEAGGSSEPGDPMRHIHIGVHGPFPEEVCIVDRRTPEQRLADADSPEERYGTLGGAAKSRFEAGDFEAARAHISELLGMLAVFVDDWNYHQAAATVQIVLGRLALQEGNIEAAKRHLTEAGRSDGSPTMSSFGPNMSLARDLLLAGEKQSVLDYFQACSKFWERGSDRLDEWAMYVNAGRIPDFGANLDY
jgi:hypothetical protein